MLIGLDFDNTIVSYDSLFHKVAIEQKVIPETILVNKIAVRNHLRSIDKESIWTEMQGYVYGERMQEAEPYKGVIEFIVRAKQLGHSICIVSHKTKYPFLGPQYDLHLSAIKWIENYLLKDGQPLFSQSEYFFEITKEEKVQRIKSCGFDMYIDDLPEILLHKHFPPNCKKILFDPEKHYTDENFEGLATANSWPQIYDLFFEYKCPDGSNT